MSAGNGNMKNAIAKATMSVKEVMVKATQACWNLKKKILIEKKRKMEFDSVSCYMGNQGLKIKRTHLFDEFLKFADGKHDLFIVIPACCTKNKLYQENPGNQG